MSSTWKACSCLEPPPRPPRPSVRPVAPLAFWTAPGVSLRLSDCCLPVVSRGESQMARAASRACSSRFPVAFLPGSLLRMSALCLPSVALRITCKALAFRSHPEASADCPQRPCLAGRAPPPCSVGTAMVSVAQSLIIPRQDSHVHAGWLLRMCRDMATHSIMPVWNRHDQDHGMDCHCSLHSGTWPVDSKADRTRLQHLST